MLAPLGEVRPSSAMAVLYSIWRSIVSLIRSISTLSAYSTIFFIVSIDLSTSLTVVVSEYSFSKRTSPFLSFLMTLVWVPAISTEAFSSLFSSSTSIWKIYPLLEGRTVNSASSLSFLLFSISSLVISDNTCSSRSSLPPTIPMLEAASIPLSPPVWGTTTLFTFFIMFGLAYILTVVGGDDRRDLHMAEA